MVLIGNKIDLEPADAVAAGIDANWRKDYGISTTSQLDSSYLDVFCEDHGFAKWFDVSALENRGIEEAFTYLGNLVLAESGNSFELKRKQQAAFKPGERTRQSPGGGQVALECC